MKGAIIINAYGRPVQSVNQANRIKDEFSRLGVAVDIILDGSLKVALEQGKLATKLNIYDFIVYLDKDKYLSEALSLCGMRLFNSHEAVRVCDDKGQTVLRLANSGVNMPDTIFGALSFSEEDKIDGARADEIIKKLSLPVVVKESFGSMGKGVYKADSREELISIMEKVKLKPHLFQEHVGEPGVDVRVIVIGGKAVCAMERRNDTDFRSNVAQGGYGKKITLDGEFKKSAEKCALVLGLDYCGVDLLYGKDNKPYVCEVNSNAFISGIEKVTGFNVAKAYAEHIISCLNK